MANSSLAWRWVTLALPSLMALPAWACEVLPLISPATHSSLALDQAELKWAAHPSNNYRVQVRVSQPEGPTLQTFDLNTQATDWRMLLTVALPSGLASVQVRVSINCTASGMDELQASPPAFFIQQPVACQVDPSSFKLNGTNLVWTPSPGAQTYRVQIASLPAKGMPSNQSEAQASLPPKLQLISQMEVQAPEAQLSKALEAAANASTPPMVTVQAFCAGKKGLPTARALSELQRP